MIQTQTQIIFKKPNHKHKDIEFIVLGKKLILCKKCNMPKIGYLDETAIYLKMELDLF